MIFLKNFCPKIKEGSLGTVEVVKVGEKKHEELEGESDQDAYVHCPI